MVQPRPTWTPKGTEKGGKGKGKKGKFGKALRRISDNVLLTMAWETNTACADFTHERFGSIQMGDDVADIDIDQIVTYIDQQLGQQQFIVLITAGPPCPDFSRMKKSPKGADGDSGWMFKHMIDVEYNLRLRFQGKPFETVIENVVPHPSLRDHLLEMTEPLCVQPIVLDASDGGLAHRKRLWWTSIDWQDVENKLARNTPWSTSWKTDDDWPRLHNPVAVDLQAPLQRKGFSLPACLQQGNKLFHCLTTPSKERTGRPTSPANRSRQMSPSTTQRWQDDHHRYPPWQYEEQFLVQWPDGTSSTAPTELREQLQGLPVGYTEKLAGGDNTQRDVALGNAWHLPTAIWIIFLVLLGTADATIPRSPHESALDKVVNLWTATRVPFRATASTRHVLYRELSDGFPLMGKLTPGVNWHVRQANRVDEHWEFMLDEILAEVKLGRMNGPFKASSWWPKPAVATSHPGADVLLDLPRDDPFIAMAFSIEQTGSDGKTKIRRGEDWRRSGHNATCIMHDQPFHHTAAHFVFLGLTFLERSRATSLRVWGHDHDGAYRQLPLHDPRQAYVLLLTPFGRTLWSHNVLLLGSAASVWSYNRFGDVLVACSRTLVLSPALHYVDDYGSMEDEVSAESSFRAFEDYDGSHLPKRNIEYRVS
ncbi:hypothetical protein AK812_SmicGene20369 [Symbiodinium microadriaticum]|uniref:Uncharacterized protein n=1 Tax=Symbiodinium microadriaticum TaxID=2951 RepID=A0A1Q9DQ87_SYMMI|nr:hypothetical protein AK812_SmicGene20369 [Symbiodinium microadriaticum]